MTIHPSVAVFSNQFASTRGHGLARYARELVRALQAGTSLCVTPFAAWSDRRADDLAALKAETGLELLKTGRRATPLAWTFAGRPRLETIARGRIDIVHAASLGYPVATGRRFVVTVHDLGPLTQPQYFANARPWVMRRSLAQAVDKADAIVCVSHTTRDEVLDVVGPAVEDRLHVVHEGVSISTAVPDLAALGTTRDLPPADVPFVLATGKISPRKNILGLMQAMGSLVADLPHHLVVAGGDGWNVGEVYDAVERFGLKGRIHFPGFVTDQELAALYDAASVYVHPSFYEGFGLTVLEAMARGTPVVTSNVTALPEVAGSAAALVNPADPDAIAHAISSICGDEARAAGLRERGLERARRFSWQAAAQQMERIYRSI